MSERDEDLLTACTRAIQEGGEPPVATDWNEIQSALLASEPCFPTVEEAMMALRQRLWSKDQ